MTLPLTGGCLCGAVRYSISAPPRFQFHCHCRDCQRHSGTGHTSRMAVTLETLTVTGELRWFRVTGDNGSGLLRGFCPTCGSAVVNEPERLPDLRMISAGTLDDPSQFSPVKSLYPERAPPWDVVIPG